MAAVPSFALNTGAKIPAIGMGAWMGTQGNEDRCEEMCKKALKVGYRHFDTSAGYLNEAAVGRAIRASGVPREEIFVTTKLDNYSHHKVAEALDASLELLGLDYVDLYLIHFPMAVVDGRTLQPHEHPTVVDTWREMEKAFHSGKARAIGVSNFDKSKIQRIIEECTVVPAVNQIELHPCWPQVDLVEFCKSKGIQVTAYSSLGQPGIKGFGNPDLVIPDVFFTSDTIKSIADKHGATIAQVMLTWAVTKGYNVIPKSENEERMKKNLTLITLDAADMVTLDNFHKGEGMHRSLLGHHTTGEVVGVFGWTYEQMGWNLIKGGLVPE